MRVEIKQSPLKSISTSSNNGLNSSEIGSSSGSTGLLLWNDNIESKSHDVPETNSNGNISNEPQPTDTNTNETISDTLPTSVNQINACTCIPIPPPPRNPRSSVRNLSSVNVVGLPHNHYRHHSVPVTLTITPSSTIKRNKLPNHSRNISAPCSNNIHNYSDTTLLNNASAAPLINQQKLKSVSSTASTPSMGHHTRSENVQVSIVNNINANGEDRNISKSLQTSENINENSNTNTQNSDIFGIICTNVGGVRTNISNNGRIPLNVSNVNVNYYRAVPVNVVSTVPTIKCLNNKCDGSTNTAANLDPNIATTCIKSSMISSYHTSTTTSANNVTASLGIDSKNVSNVNIVHAMPLLISNSIRNVVRPFSSVMASPTTITCTEVIVHNTPMTTVTSENLRISLVPDTVSLPLPRTFTSTEAQTDTVMPSPESTISSREQRRQERLERRHQRRLNNSNHRHINRNMTSTASTNSTSNDHHQAVAPVANNGRIPDLLNITMAQFESSSQLLHNHSHPITHAQLQQPTVIQPGIVVPPGTIVQGFLPNSLVQPTGLLPFHPHLVSGQVPLVQATAAIPVSIPASNGFRFQLRANGFRRSRYSEDSPKSCCGLLAWRPRSLRWFIALIALVAICCVLVGTALGAMRPSGKDHLTVSLLMIGVGIVLVTVSGVAWRLTSHDSSTCRLMLGLGSTDSMDTSPRRFVPRLPPSYGRPHHPYAAMMYPEFSYRPPPPSYQASMQEYRLRLLLLDRGSTPQIQSGLHNAVSPPPTYRSHTGSLLRVPLSNCRGREAPQSEYSIPPSYRSLNSSSRAAATAILPHNLHSREQSFSFCESNQDGSGNGSVVNVVNIFPTNEENITLDSFKLESQGMNQLKLLLNSPIVETEGAKDGNLVTIVQTNEQSPVIVTVSGSSNTDNCKEGDCGNVQLHEMSNEMEILAHL